MPASRPLMNSPPNLNSCFSRVQVSLYRNWNIRVPSMLGKLNGAPIVAPGKSYCGCPKTPGCGNVDVRNRLYPTSSWATLLLLKIRDHVAATFAEYGSWMLASEGYVWLPSENGFAEFQCEPRTD